MMDLKGQRTRRNGLRGTVDGQRVVCMNTVRLSAWSHLSMLSKPNHDR
jgi:hypothetical protein